MRPDNLPQQFFCDYGGFEHETQFLYTKKSHIAHLLRRYRRNEIHFSGSQYTYDISGIIVILYSFGNHRCAYVALPNTPTDDQLTRYQQAYDTANELDSNAYALLSDNCVRATAKIISCLHNKIDPTVWLPYFQFSALEKYPGIQKITRDDFIDPTFLSDHTDSTLIQQFLESYHAIAEKKWFQKKYWSKENPVWSLETIYEHAIGLYAGSGLRTKTTLLSLGWIHEDHATGLLLPTEQTPKRFKDIIDSLMPISVIHCLSHWYTEGGGSIKSRIILFNQATNCIKLLKALANHAKKNPRGASHFTLMKLIDFMNVNSTHPLTLFFSPHLLEPDIISTISSNEKDLIRITPRQFIFLLSSGFRNFSQIAFWQSEHIATDPELQAALRELSLSHVSLGASIAEGLFGYVNFFEAAIYGAHFLAKTDLPITVNFKSTLLTQVTFDNCHFSSSVFSHSSMRQCRFINCTFNNTQAIKMMLSSTVFDECEIAHSDFSSLYGSKKPAERILFRGCRISHSLLKELDAEECCFKSCDLTKVDMNLFIFFARAATFEECIFSQMECKKMVFFIQNNFVTADITAMLNSLTEIARQSVSYTTGFFNTLTRTNPLSQFAGYTAAENDFERFLCVFYSKGELREKFAGCLHAEGERLVEEKNAAAQAMTQPLNAN